jgi:hypothetical protein
MNVSFAPLKPDAIDYLSSGIGIDFGPAAPFASGEWLCVTARDDHGAIMGVIVSQRLNPFEGSFHSVVSDPRCATRRLLKAVYTALFSQVVRLTALIDPGNRRAIKNATAMGFVVEGLCRRGIDGRRDGLVFGMLREDCKFLRPAPVRRMPRYREVRMPLHG